MNEFDIIKTYFAPLSKNSKGALNLTDDAAIITSIGSDLEFIITKDALSEDVHFFKNDDPFKLAQKLMGVNLSDLASMGATPYGFLLALHLPKSISVSWLEQFSAGIKHSLDLYGGSLLGGDTIIHEAPLSMSLTAIGTVPKNKALLRSGAKISDLIYVSNYIGDSCAGLQILKNPEKFPALEKKHKEYLQERYFVPRPNIILGQKLINIANSCIDISDGLISDLDHICETSKVSATIYIEQIPISEAAIATSIDIKNLLTGGDDYELLFTVPQDKQNFLEQINIPNLKLTKIGTITSGSGIIVLDKDNKEIPFNKTGYQHNL